MPSDEPMDLDDNGGSTKVGVLSTLIDNSMDHESEVKDNSPLIGVQKQRSVFCQLLGVAYDEENGVYNELSKNLEILRKLHGFVDKFPDGVFFDQGSLKIKIDEVIAECFVDVCVVNSASEDEKSLGQYFLYDKFNVVPTSHAGRLLKYVFRVFNACQQYLQRNDVDEGLERNIKLLKDRLLCNYLLELRGFSASSDSQDIVVAAFVRTLLLDEFPAGFLQKLLEIASLLPASSSVIQEAFDPILSRLRFCVDQVTVFKNGYGFNPYRALNTLLAIKTTNGSRPICNLIVSRADFCPDLDTDGNGREFARLCYFGAFLNKSVGEVTGETDRMASSQRFEGISKLNSEDSSRFLFYARYHDVLSTFRIELHKAFHSILVSGAPNRESILDFIAKMLKYNYGKAMIQVDPRKNIDDGFMINFACVMMHLSERISLDVVRPNYIFHPKCRLHLEEETRLKFDSDEVKEFSKTLEFVDEDLKFTTECFFLTMVALRLGFNATIASFKQVKREAVEINAAVRRIEGQLKDIASKNPLMVTSFQARLNKIKEIQKSTVCHLLALECMVSDVSLLSSTVRFVTKQFGFLGRLISPQFFTLAQLPVEAPTLFGMMPEFMLESVLDILRFALKTNSKFLNEISHDFTKTLLVFLCNSQYFNNPFLMAKIVEVVFLACTIGTDNGMRIFLSITHDPLAKTYLFPRLVKFYSDIETTGAQSEFYDKFNIRREIQFIFRVLWGEDSYRCLMIETARANSDDFIRFINMIINDATFLLDESLNGLKKICEIEQLMKDTVRFNQLSEEDQKSKRDALEENSRIVSSWTVLGEETMTLFETFTHDAPDVFRTEMYGERIAVMLNNNILQLCGPKCTELKVEKPKRFNYNPKKTVEQIINVYLNLSSESFCKCVAYDERSYTPERFDDVLKRLANTNSLSSIHMEKFTNLCAMAKVKYQEKANDEEDWEDFPDEFGDELMGSLMSDPVRLPSGHVLDRKTINRHLLTVLNNPFTREKLTESQLIEVPELRQRIHDWKAEKKRQGK